MSRLRNRIRKADYFSDGELLRWPRDKRTTYSGLWAMAEDSGCLEDDCFEWKMSLWPSPLDSDITVELLEQWRDELIEAGKLIPYEADGKRYLYLRNFHQHEKPTNPQRPDLPLPPWVSADVAEGRAKDGKKWSRCAIEVCTELVPPRHSISTESVQSQYRPESTTDSPQMACIQRSPVLSRPDQSRPDPNTCGPNSDESAPTDVPKAVKVKAPDWQSKADALLEKSRFPSDLMQLSEILAAENKTGKVALSRVVSQLYEPLVALQSEFSDDALRHGLRAAITNMAPNANYVRKAALKYVPCATASAAKPTTDYDDLLEG